ncbi:hypothetical protein WA158_001462 [Blastocystis sp. Blastoise]
MLSRALRLTATAKLFKTALKARAFSQISYEGSKAFVRGVAPTFKAPAVINGDLSTLNIDDYKGQYVVLFFYPKDFTFVCPTEIIAFSDRIAEFEKLNTKVIACSCDSQETHLAWIKTPRKQGGLGHMKIPIVSDITKEIASKYGVLVPEAGIALRGLFIINPQGVIEQITVNNFPVGRNVDEVIRLIEAFQFVAEHGEVCPANWKPGNKTIVPDTEKSLDFFESGETEKQEEPIDLHGKVIKIKNPKEVKDLINSGKPTVFDFYAPYCGKCRMAAPYFSQLSEEIPEVNFASIDTTDEALLALQSDFSIKALPAFHFFKNGKEVGAPITGYKRQPVLKQIKDLLL